MSTRLPPKKTMVCVTEQKTCERLIRRGAELAQGEDLHVLHVVRNGGSVLGGRSESDALEYLFQISREYGAEMDVLRSDDVIGTIVQVAQDSGCEYLVIGAARGRSQLDVDNQLKMRLPDVRVIIDT